MNHKENLQSSKNSKFNRIKMKEVRNSKTNKLASPRTLNLNLKMKRVK